MAFCIMCGTKIDDSESKCSNCGFVMIQTPDQADNNPGVQSAAQPAPQPAAQSAPQPVAQPAPQPVAQPAPQPVAQSAPQPVAQAATQSKGNSNKGLIIALSVVSAIALLAVGIIISPYILNSINDSNNVSGYGSSVDDTEDNTGTTYFSEVDYEIINSEGTSMTCQIGNTIYYISDESLYRLTDNESYSEMLLNSHMFVSIRDYDNKLYCAGYNYLGYNNSNFELLCYDPKSENVNTILSIPVWGPNDSYTELLAFCIEDNVVYYIKSIDEGSSYAQECTYEIRSVNTDGSNEQFLYKLPDIYSVPWGSSLSFYRNKLYFIVKDEDTYDNWLMEVDTENRQMDMLFDWQGDYGDIFIYANGYAFISSGNELFYCDLDGTHKHEIYYDENIDHVGIIGSKVFYGISDMYLEEYDGTYWATKEIFVYDIETGQNQKIYDGFCYIAGAIGEWIYFYDESNLEGISSFEEHTWNQKLCRIRLDGTGYMELP